MQLISTDEAERLIRVAMQQEPDLTRFGIGASPAHGFAVERAALLRPWSVERLRHAVAYIQTVGIAKRPSSRVNSYGIKHFASHWVRRNIPGTGDGYMTNGVFIAACVGLGAPIRRILSHDNPNVDSPNVDCGLRVSGIKMADQDGGIL